MCCHPRDVREEIVGNSETPGTQVLDGAVEVDGVPVDDRGGDEAQAGCLEALILEGPVTGFALVVGTDPSCTVCWSTTRRRRGRRPEARPPFPLAEGRAAHHGADRSAGAGFRSITENIGHHNPAGRMMMQLIRSFAEYERATVR